MLIPRYKEQKQRIGHCGLPNKIYLVEEIGFYKDVGHNNYNKFSKERKGLDRNALDQAMSNTLIKDGFHVKLTKSQTESMRYLSVMTKTLKRKFEDMNLNHCPLDSIRECPSDKYLLEFKEFYEFSRPDKPLTMREIFCNMLICQKSLSAPMAWAITEKYPTLHALKSAYDNCNSDKEKENLLSGIQVDGRKNKISASVSKVLYWLFNDYDFERNE